MDTDDLRDWLWDVFDTGLTAAALVAMELQIKKLEKTVAAVNSANTATNSFLRRVGNMGDVTTEGSESLWERFTKWLDELWEKVKKCFQKLTQYDQLTSSSGSSREMNVELA